MHCSVEHSSMNKAHFLTLSVIIIIITMMINGQTLKSQKNTQISNNPLHYCHSAISHLRYFTTHFQHISLFRCSLLQSSSGRQLFDSPNQPFVSKICNARFVTSLNTYRCPLYHFVVTEQAVRSRDKTAAVLMTTTTNKQDTFMQIAFEAQKHVSVFHSQFTT